MNDSGLNKRNTPLRFYSAGGDEEGGGLPDLHQPQTFSRTFEALNLLGGSSDLSSAHSHFIGHKCDLSLC